MIMYVATGLFLYNRNGPMASAVFFLLCLPLYFLYNTFEKRQYNRHFKQFINLHFKDRIGKPIQFEFEADGIHLTDEEDNRFLYTDIEWISETSTLIIIQMKSGNAFIIPKSKIDPIGAFSTTLQDSATKASIPFNKELGWKWK